MVETAELDAALTDVRRAYRLLSSYQRRLLGLIRTFAEAFDSHEFYYWTPLLGLSPARGSDPSATSSASWRMLPMSWASFLYLPQSADRNHPRAGEWMLEIALRSDTGISASGSEEPEASDFPDAAQCSSDVSLVAWQCTAPVDANWLNGIWSAIDWPKEDEKIVESAEPPFRLIKKTFKLTTILGKDDVDRAAVEFKAILSRALGEA
jgi:hypothetical protein